MSKFPSLQKLASAADPKFYEMLLNRVSKIRAHGTPQGMVNKTNKQLDDLIEYTRQIGKGVKPPPGEKVRKVNQRYLSKHLAARQAKNRLKAMQSAEKRKIAV